MPRGTGCRALSHQPPLYRCSYPGGAARIQGLALGATHTWGLGCVCSTSSPQPHPGSQEPLSARGTRGVAVDVGSASRVKPAEKVREHPSPLQQKLHCLTSKPGTDLYEITGSIPVRGSYWVSLLPASEGLEPCLRRWRGHHPRRGAQGGRVSLQQHESRGSFPKSQGKFLWKMATLRASPVFP